MQVSGASAGRPAGKRIDNGGVPEVERPKDEPCSGWERGGLVDELVFGTRSVSEIDALVDRVLASELGAGIAEVLFRATSVGVVVGVVLTDSRRVVVKGHQPRETMLRLQAVHEIQAELFRAGFPCPQPLVGPVSLTNGHLTVEALLDAGEFRDTHDPICRQLIAEALAWHLAVTNSRPADALAGGWSLFEAGRLWPRHAHAPIFDFNSTSAGAEWIDALGAQAKARLGDPGPLVAGHSDWSGKHFRFANGEITAIYDWDSLAARPEAAIVGIAAMTFTTRFDLPGVSRAPTPEEMRAFVDEYSAARKTPLTHAERGQVAAHALLLAAYTARCEHCGIDGYEPENDPDSFVTALRAHQDSYLRI